MATTRHARPELSHLQSLPHSELVLRYKTGVENFDPAVVKLTDAQLDTAFRPEAAVGTWPCRVLLGHLADSEILFTHRIRRVVGEERPIFSVWDEQAFIDGNVYGTPQNGSLYPVGAFIAVIHTQRLWMAGWLETLSEDLWQRSGMHPERGPQSARRIVEYCTWHLEHHAWYLNAKVARLTQG